MKFKDEQIKKIAIKVLNDLDWPYDKKKGVRPLEHSIENQIEEVSTQKKHPKYNEYIATLFSYWRVHFDFPEDDNWQGRNIMWVLIKDETGEPYEVGHRQWKGKVMKDSNGKYYKENY